MTRSGRREDHTSISTARSRGLSWYYRSTSESLVATRWRSSERPLFVRTVWVGGIRHAILSLDDPLLSHTHQQQSSAVHCRKPSLGNVSSTSDDAALSETSTGSSSGREMLIDYFSRDDVGGREEEERKGRTKDKRKIKKKYRCHAVHTLETDSETDNNIDFTKAFDSTSPDTHFFLSEESRNALSERVFQWLDLSRRASKAGSNALGKSRTPTKRSANPVAYYLQPPNPSQTTNILLPKRLPRSSLPMVLEQTQTETTVTKLDVTPRRSSCQEVSTVNTLSGSSSGKTFHASGGGVNGSSLGQPIRHRSNSSTVHNRCSTTVPADNTPTPLFNQRIIEPRPVTSWTRMTTPGMASKPQLHIFMPHLPHGRNASFEGSDCMSSSGIEQ